MIEPSNNSHSANKNLAIVGAGLVGRLLAWRLISLGHQVSLFEKDSFDCQKSAAYTAAAMISPMSEVVVSDRSIYDLGIKSLDLWPEWIESLNAKIHQPVHYHNPGSIVVAHPNDLSELEQFHNELDFHLGPDNNSKWLTRDELEYLEPDLLPQFNRALYLPGEAHLDNRQLLEHLLEQIKHLGGHCLDQSVFEFDTHGKINGDALTGFDLIFDCRGFGISRSPLPKGHSIRGVRGEVLWVQTDELSLHRPIRLMHPRYKLYIVPKPDNCFIIGATEIESQDNSPVSVRSALELCSALYSVNPAFAEARILEFDANLRPAFVDNLPLTERLDVKLGTQETQQFVSINGLYRHGYLLAPALIERVLQDLNLDTVIK